MRLEIGEVFTKIINADVDTIHAIDEECSYLLENWEFAKQEMIRKAQISNNLSRLQYANDWDGRIRLMKGASFPTGLLKRVLERLEIEGVSGVEIMDRRQRPVPVGQSLKMTSNFQERDYQTSAINIAFKQTRGVIKAPTGAGKTVIGTALIAKAHVPTLIIVNKQVLMEQWQRAILDFIDIPFMKGQSREGYVGTVQGRNVNPSVFTIAMAQTLQGWLRKDPNQFKSFMKIHPTGWQMLIEDEVHGVGAEGRYELNLHIPSFYRYGFSATPFDRADANLRVEAAIGPTVYEIESSDLIEQGHIVRPKIKFHPVDSMYFGPWNKYMDIYRDGIVHNTKRNKKIIDIAINAALKGKKVLVFVNFIRHGEILQGLLNERTVMHVDGRPGAEGTFIHAGSEHREMALKEFKSANGTIDILIAIDKLIGEGFDYRGIDVIIIADGGKSSIETIQKVGRGTRTFTGKTHVEIHDFVDRALYLYDHARARIATWRNPVLGYEVDLSEVPYINKE